MSIRFDEEWTLRAACAARSPDELFVQGAAQREAREICFTCPVRLECLVDALDNRIQFGVWGGMTERERRALLRNEPDVDSWRIALGELDDEELDTFIGTRRSKARRWVASSGVS
ncbi:WhiB family transcriptional regulator [Ruania halotolerans]|uniref:WhiB family transcriptional regulator n=1 Tax=Ruania halotolerans TaxID=2897773 RepID=UPI001E643F82|nr:WhiB family transcriptional regulator [Ruania halotolerans]UFU07125.1 WhiB family transcriptional regulator [Ruania halotolerans]